MDETATGDVCSPSVALPRFSFQHFDAHGPHRHSHPWVLVSAHTVQFPHLDPCSPPSRVFTTLNRAGRAQFNLLLFFSAHVHPQNKRGGEPVFCLCGSSVPGNRLMGN
jgi:hypothetical protein